MKKKIFLTLLVCALFIPIIKASNDNPTINSTIRKDGSLDFDLNLTDLELDESKEYEWAIVANQAATPEDSDWEAPKEYTSSTMYIYLDFVTDENTPNKIQNVIGRNDDAYLVVREKATQNIVINHAKFNASIPYAYGAVPYKNQNNVWTIKAHLFAGNYNISVQPNRKLHVERITDKNVINGYLNLKESNGEVNAGRLADYINTLNLELPSGSGSFKLNANVVGTGLKDSEMGITEKGLCFIWGAYNTSDYKTVYGVTIYDNGYDGSENTQTPTTTEPKKETSNTVESPSTGVSNYMISGIALLVITLGIYGVYKKKFN